MNNEAKTFDPNDVNENKGLAIVMAIIPVLFFLPLVMPEKKSSMYLTHQANQTLIYFILAVASGIITGILGLIPVVGGILKALIPLAIFVVYIINIVNAATGNGKGIPFIGSIEIIK